MSIAVVGEPIHGCLVLGLRVLGLLRCFAPLHVVEHLLARLHAPLMLNQFARADDRHSESLGGNAADLDFSRLGDRSSNSLLTVPRCCFCGQPRTYLSLPLPSKNQTTGLSVACAIFASRSMEIRCV